MNWYLSWICRHEDVLLTDYCVNWELLAQYSISTNLVWVSYSSKWWGGLVISTNQNLYKHEEILKLTANIAFVSFCYFCPFLVNLFVHLLWHFGQFSKHYGQVFNFLPRYSLATYWIKSFIYIDLQLPWKYEVVKSKLFFWISHIYPCYNIPL